MVKRNKNLIIVAVVLLGLIAVMLGAWRLMLSGDANSEGIISGFTSINPLLILMLLCVGMAFGLIAIVPIRRSCNSVLDHLSEDILRINTDNVPELQVPVDSMDSLSRLTYNVNQMLAHIERSKKDALRENAELRKNVKALRTLAEIDREITSKSKSESILELVCSRAPDLLDVPMAAVVLKDNPGRPVASFGFGFPEKFTTRGNDLLNVIAMKGTPFGHGIYSFAGKDVDSLLIPDSHQIENIQSAAVALLIVESQVLGALLVFDRVARYWSVEETQHLSLLAAQAALALDAAWLFEEEEARREELSSLFGLSRVLADANPDTDSILELITRNTVDKVHVTFARAALMEDGHFIIRSANPIRMLRRELDAPIREKASVDFLNKVIEANRIQVIHRGDKLLSQAQRRDLLLDLARTICLVPFKTEKGTAGLLMLGEERRHEREPFTEEKRRLVRNIGDQTVSALRRAELFEELANAYLETVMALANAVDVKDTYTGDHGRRLADMALAIGRRLGMTTRELRDLHFGAILHDIGKIGIPDAILQKPARLNEEEWQYIQKHTVLGERILAPVSSLSGATAIVRHHHERYDGGGYPDGLAGGAIPLGARIMTVVDSFCAMIDKRTYKESTSVDKAVAELKKCSGSQFDPQIVSLMVNLLEEGVISVGEAETIAEEGPATTDAA